MVEYLCLFAQEFADFRIQVSVQNHTAYVNLWLISGRSLFYKLI